MSIDSPETIQDLLDRWTRMEGIMENHGVPAGARAYAHARRELEAVHHRLWEKELSVAQAAEVSGYSEEHLRRLFKEGDLRGAKRDGRIWLFREDLPMKPRAEDPQERLYDHEA